MNFPEDLRNQIKTHIAGRCGLYFRDHDLKNLEAGVKQRMRACGFDSVHFYYAHLTASSDKDAEFRELLNLLTTQHTYFFRNEPQFIAFKENVLKEFIERKGAERIAAREQKKRSLRIWSAGCSTGEEPYTIAMILRETIPRLEDWDIEIYATDASSEAMEKAKKGVYNENAMRLVGAPYRSKYFTRIALANREGAWKISEEIKGMVHFGFLNLVGDPYPLKTDVIFCCNVMIYFEIKTTMKILEKFRTCLTDTGFLFLGYSESLQFITDQFRMASWRDGIYYRKSCEQSEALAPALFR